MENKLYCAYYAYKHKNSNNENISRSKCHSTVNNINLDWFSVAIMDNKAGLNQIREYLKLLESIGIYSEIIAATEIKGFKGYKSLVKKFIKLDVKKTSKKYNSDHSILFAYEILRYCLKYETFVKQILELRDENSNLNAWQLINLAWNNSPRNSNNWYQYHDAIRPNKNLHYVSIHKLIKYINEFNHIETVFNFIACDTKTYNKKLSKNKLKPVYYDMMKLSENKRISLLNERKSVNNSVFMIPKHRKTIKTSGINRANYVSIEIKLNRNDLQKLEITL